MTDDEATPRYRLVSPDGGELWRGQSFETHNIMYEANNTEGNTNIYLINSNGTNAHPIVEDIPSSPNMYTWNPDDNVPYGTYRIKIESVDDPTVYDISDATVEVTSVDVNYHRIETPNGGEVWQQGTMRDIMWSRHHYDNNWDHFVIDAYNEDGTYHSEIIDLDGVPVSGDIYMVQWEVDLPLGNYYIKVKSVENNDVYDFSDGLVRISGDEIEPTLSIIFSSDSFGTGQNIDFNWLVEDQSTIVYTSLNISYDSLNTQIPVFAIVDSTGESIPNEFIFNSSDSIISNQSFFVLEVSDRYGNTSIDTSAIFEIKDIISPEITLISPLESFSILENQPFSVIWENNDNIGIYSHLFEYSSDGIEYDILLNTTELADSNTTEISIIDVTEYARLKLTVFDSSNNLASIYSPTFTIIDNTRPEVSLDESLVDSTLYIAQKINISWASGDNVGVDTVQVDYRLESNQWVQIIKDNSHIEDLLWTVPDIPTENLSLRIIVYDGVGLSDTSIVDGINVLISYPKVVSNFPEAGLIGWDQRNFIFEFSQSLNPDDINSDNIMISSNYSTVLNPIISYNDSLSLIQILLSESLVSSDSLTITISDNVSNIFGYRLDGNNDGEGGGNYSISFSTKVFADFDNNSLIDVDDLFQFINALEVKDFNYELGPFVGDIPHVFVDPDNNFDIEDIVAFAMMWNWYSSNNTILFQEYEKKGRNIAFEVDSDSIHFNLPTDILVYQIQVKYEPGNVFFQSNKKENSLYFTKKELESGVYTIMASHDDSKISIPIEIVGKDANIRISYKGLDSHGDIVGTTTKSMTIENIPDQFILYPNYPNPFNPQTKIDFALPKASYVSLIIYDIMGREVKKLIESSYEPGFKSIIWNGTNSKGNLVGAGMYFYAIQTREFQQIRKMILLK